MKKFLFILLLLFSIIITGQVFAQGLKLEASLERTRVSPGNPVYLYVTFFGSQDAPAPNVSQIKGLNIKYVGPATKVSIVNGKVSKSISHTYLIIPQKDGEYKLGPYSIKYNGKVLVSVPLTLRVENVPSGMTASAKRKSAAQARAAARASSSVNTSANSSYQRQASSNGKSNEGYQSDRIFVVMDVDKTTMYVNEKIDVTIKLFVNNMEVKDIGYPVYSHEGFTTEEFDKPERTVEYVRGVRYEVLVFRQTIFGVKEGKFTLGPAKIECNIVSRAESSRRNSFFGMDNFFSSRFGSKTYPVDLISDDIPVHVLPFPREGRLPDFRGAVGDFSLEVYPQSSKVKLGDPIVVKSIVKGYGNLATVTAPVISDLKGFKTYEPQVTVKGVSKIYEQILIPTSEDIKEIPSVSFSFFDPRTRKYVLLEKGPFPLTVEASPDGAQNIKMVSADVNSKHVYMPQEELGKDIIHIKERMGRLSVPGRYVYDSKIFWAVQAVPVFLLFFMYHGYRKKERVLKDTGYARLLKAPRKARKGLNKAKSFLAQNNKEMFFDVLFKTFRQYMGDKFNLSKGDISYHVLDLKLHEMNCEKKIMDRIKHIFERSDMIRYSSISSDDDPRDFLENVREIIDYLEKKKI